MAIEYLHVSYDFINNEAGELMLIMDKCAGEADDENAKFVFDGFAEAMLVRNSGQIVHFPIIVEAIREMLGEIKIILVTEMDGDDIDDVYEAPVNILNNPLPIPRKE
jgi:hypothetical protein